MMILMRLLMMLPLCLMVSCAGYRLGGAKPLSLAGVQSVSVVVFKNETLHPRAEAMATSAVADALVKDGTYRIVRRAEADAVLEGKVSAIDYAPLRGTRADSLRPEELINTVRLSWVLRDARNPEKVLASGSSEGRSQLFVAANLQTARNNALAEAFERAGDTLVSRISNGY